MKKTAKKWQQLDPLSRGRLFLRWKEKRGWSFHQIARQIKKSPAFVVNSVRLLRLPEAIKDGLLGRLISEGHARALGALENPQECINAYKEVLKQQLSVRETEALVKEIKEKQRKKEKEWQQKFEKKAARLATRLSGRQVERVVIKQRKDVLVVTLHWKRRALDVLIIPKRERGQ